MWLQWTFVENPYWKNHLKCDIWFIGAPISCALKVITFELSLSDSDIVKFRGSRSLQNLVAVSQRYCQPLAADI